MCLSGQQSAYKQAHSGAARNGRGSVKRGGAACEEPHPPPAVSPHALTKHTKTCRRHHRQHVDVPQGLPQPGQHPAVRPHGVCGARCDDELQIRNGVCRNWWVHEMLNCLVRASASGVFAKLDATMSYKYAMAFIATGEQALRPMRGGVCRSVPVDALCVTQLGQAQAD